MAEKKNTPGQKKTPAKAPAKTSAKTPSKAPQKTSKPTAKAPQKTAEPKADMVYHISKRKEDRKWQVKAEGAAKAVKLFFTQDEAIEYAKTVAGNQEGRIVIHKEDGSFRKLKY